MTGSVSINPWDVRIPDRLRQLDDQWVEQLKGSIAEIGLTTPITVTPDLTLIAGHHRVAACRALDIKKIPALVLKLDELRTELAEIDENLIRNELSVLERGEHMKRRKEIYETLNPETRKGAKNQYTKVLNPDSGSSKSFIDDTADKTGKSRTVIAEEVRIADKIAAPLRDRLRGTETAKSKADLMAIASLDLETQGAVVEKIDNGQARNAREAIAQLRREDRIEVTLAEAVQGKYQVIYADPPWRYSNSGFDGSAEGQYPTMATEDICAMPVKDRSASNAVILMWAVNPLLEDAFAVMKAWGFDYKTNFVWVKNNHVGGFYCLGRHELLLVGVKGSCLPRKGSLAMSDLHYPRSEHSKKPHEVYELIERMYEGPYLEMFARNQRPNWTSFGNDPAVAKKAG